MERPITILGGGIIGICIALSLIERGYKVCLIDRDAPGQATSLGNAGVISPWSIVPQSMPGVWKNIPHWLMDPLGPVSIRPGYLPSFVPWGLRFLSNGRETKVRANSKAMEVLNRDCIDGFRAHLKGTGAENLLRDSCYVHVYRSPDGANLHSLENTLRREAGAELERLDADGLMEFEPDLSPDFKSAVVIKGQARALSPGRIGEVLAKKFVSMGGDLRCETIKWIKPIDGQWSYGTDAGEFLTPKVVLAMGVWSSELLKPLGVRLPLESERGYHVCFTNPEVSLNHSVMDADRKFVASSMEDGLRVAGTAEFSGLDAVSNPKRLEGLIKLARGISPRLNADPHTTWSGQRPSFPDSLPVIGSVPGLPNLTLAFGHSHYGLMQAPRTGQIVADLVSGAPPNIDLAAFSPTRF